ncbi:helix-turn-helix domain-containing protein [Lactiplantibacillus nangangensis]|uniref:Helix-turn-helix domain-containing protein n=1 Tax=Lactiplantibacillus nangangensis TaxID=2559917 RepID=A0ABW1SMV4_9LACO|nr:helix-turn-helix transcriptional regulator [Lactiplantibacillus nangangensis]
MSSSDNLRNEVLNFGPKIKEIRNDKRFTIRQAALQAGISSSFWSQVENKKREIPRPNTLKKMAAGLRISDKEIFELAGITANTSEEEHSTNKDHYYDLTEKDERGIDKELEDMMSGLDSKNSLSFFQNGAELSDDDKELLKASMRQTLELSKQLAKRKFTPKKYRHGEE